MKDIERKFLTAYDDYSEAIYQHCFFRVYNRQKAQDIMQETFLHAWQYMSGRSANVEMPEIKNMRALLYKIATNLIIDDSRHKKEEYLDALIEQSEANEPAVEHHKDIERNELLNEVRQVMRFLDEEEQRILTLRYFDDLDPKDIAEIFGITANSASVKLHRAVQSLRELFTEGRAPYPRKNEHERV